jgi:hypothetical protein
LNPRLSSLKLNLDMDPDLDPQLPNTHTHKLSWISDRFCLMNEVFRWESQGRKLTLKPEGHRVPMESRGG